MRRFVTMALLACFAFLQMNAEILSNDEVTLVVSADGASKDEAVKLALRSAIEQTYGAFVSSNTVLLNDELVKDEIVTVSSGNVKEYKELTSNKLPNGRTYVTLQATVSVSNLIKFAQSKGEKVEFDGANLVMNIQLEELNAKSQDKVLENLKTQLEPLILSGFNYSLKMKDVTKVYEEDETSERYKIFLVVKASPNKNLDAAIDLLKTTLENLNVPNKQRLSAFQYETYYIEQTDKKDFKSRMNNIQLVQGINKIQKALGNTGYTLRASNYSSDWFDSITDLFNRGINYFYIDNGKSRLQNNSYLRCAKNDHNTLTIENHKFETAIVVYAESKAELSQYKDFEIKSMSNF